ncbi:ATP-dependent protease [Thioclava sp. SK-1]|uniref:LON peptidase substrate-binding domain-containing protein n=1 Tax=Thioclava sp. SK-1 TaxID=1889770 RepID=UPI000825558A|nr:LON peptidase substrate-binding domain-containing protein [Thioclava sp. SK-1]OCX59846.1 ATP-dependent protease [Thioclava sp. SK-1]
MMRHGDLPQTLSLFPLPGALLLPRGRLPLHIFEPRYLQMIDDVLKTPDRLMGMIQPSTGPGKTGSLSQIGCAGRLTGFSETEDGRYMITLSGVSRFRVTEELDSDTPYLRAKVTWSSFEKDLGKPEHDPDLDRDTFFELLARFFHAEGMDTDWESLREAEDELLLNSLSMLLPLGPEDKQALLEAPCLQTRRETLVTLLEFALRSGGEEHLQ